MLLEHSELELSKINSNSQGNDWCNSSFHISNKSKIPQKKPSVACALLSLFFRNQSKTCNPKVLTAYLWFRKIIWQISIHHLILNTHKYKLPISCIGNIVIQISSPFEWNKLLGLLRTPHFIGLFKPKFVDSAHHKKHTFSLRFNLKEPKIPTSKHWSPTLVSGLTDGHLNKLFQCLMQLRAKHLFATIY